MSLNPGIAVATTRAEDCVIDDPVFAALRKERHAFQAYSDTLAVVTRIGASGKDIPQDCLFNENISQLSDWEAAEAKASMALVEAEQELLATKPATVQGAAAMLGYLQEHLKEEPDINPVREALGNIQAFLNDSGHR